jgi:uncharacterized membrane protein
MPVSVLFVGESWASIGFHLKGFSVYTTGGYEEGGQPLISALENDGHKVTYIRNHEVNAKFPLSSEDLAPYGAVVLSDVPADTFLLHPDTLSKSKVRPNSLREIADYVERGGGLLMVGGYMSFSGFEGKARYQNTVLADVLPVNMLGTDDRIEMPEGAAPEVVMSHAVLEDVEPKWPIFLGYQRLVAKSDSQTLMTIGNDPFLVLGQYGKGRVAAFASDCSPHWGPPEFLNWPSYSTFWSRLIEWLSNTA